MNVRYRVTKLAVAFVFASVAGAANADIVGTQTGTSGTTSITVGESQVPFGPHTAGLAGVGVSSYGGGSKVDFQGLVASATASADLGNSILSYEYDGNAHPGLGSFSFIKVGSGDVWFGEWSTDGSPNYTNRQVYYVGDNDGTTLPTSTATYTTKGINQGDILSGTLTATFGGTNTLSGTLTGSSLTVALNAAINSTDASFSGSALANSSSVGTTTGNFFGASATALAGIADFGTDSAYNTAFGGTKN